jgi:hypothetical protein
MQRRTFLVLASAGVALASAPRLARAAERTTAAYWIRGDRSWLVGRPGACASSRTQHDGFTLAELVGRGGGAD